MRRPRSSSGPADTGPRAPVRAAAGRRPRRLHHVVVLGGGLAGLFAAAAAAGDGRSVTVLERDRLPDGPEPRDGVPQGRHAHVYLYRGLLAVEELLPGFGAELRAAGAVPLDTGALAWLGENGWAPAGRQFEVLSASRPLFEHLVRCRVRGVAGVEVRDGVRVRGLRRGRAGGPAWEVDVDGGPVAADLVVDAMGRSSRLPAWLAAAGVPVPAVSEVDARIGYATRVFSLDRQRLAVPGIVLMQTPAHPRGGIVLPLEGGRFVVGLVGSGEDRPPRDNDGYTRFLAGLRDDAIAELTRTGTPETDVVVHRQTANRRHHYERLRGLPAGLLVVGDALCAFNPIYGQGVTVAACEALLLRDALTRGLRRGDERRLVRRFCRVAALPWSIATNEDLRYAASTGSVPRVQSALGAWARQVDRLAVRGDPHAGEVLGRVYHLMGSPLNLFRPALVVRVVRGRLRGLGPPMARPEITRVPAG
ncbi:NAD(P)/FAD-dependent oxidoreductase [Georgenia sp. H159]|uniref:NAD(P)/FAD-dependent oxidoreductase n=1 Tax=Georgenia sp. H159 TaxID=3076115 RepID=UPI002D76ED0D|nr:NAD(P)-binding protein [Georgenia sp. H159]